VSAASMVIWWLALRMPRSEGWRIHGAALAAGLAACFALAAEQGGLTELCCGFTSSAKKFAYPLPLDDFASRRRESSSLFHRPTSMMARSDSFQRLGENSRDRRSLQRVAARIA
jgi:hypothetical protein